MYKFISDAEYDEVPYAVYLPKGRPSMNLGGRPVDPVREAWTMRYELTRKQKRNLPVSLMNQLSMCRSEEARRLILGVKERDLCTPLRRGKVGHAKN